MLNITTNTPGFENIVNGAQEIRKIEAEIYSKASTLDIDTEGRVLDALSNYDYANITNVPSDLQELATKATIADENIQDGIDRMAKAVGRETAEQFAVNARLIMDSTQ